MSRPATLAPAAQKDLRAAVAWIARDNETAARALRAAVSVAARRIGERPEIGRLRPELTSSRYRFWSLSGFPYLLVYDVSAVPPRIARVLHMARDLPTALMSLDPPSGE
ncbi:MAG TPA: type II toxin-antitoxin system RelE/ParE family toxin [Myxococcota bacterium]|nr:type II toxin-antitoxin system RelE/ParE family toxin [Myxococcota bacterium]